jgi:hypothetical protein
LINYQGFIEPLVEFNDITKEIPYDGHNKLNKVLPYSIHNGQRKLFLNKLQFLTDHLDKHDSHALVVYAGAAPSNPASHFIELFPNVRWLLVDPNPFFVFNHAPTVLIDKNGKQGVCSNITDSILYFGKTRDKICIINDLFTDEIAQQLSGLSNDGHDILFISDIRTEVGVFASSPGDLDILWNSAQQYNWITLMNPRASMLKWRHPFHEPGDNSVLTMKDGPWIKDFKTAKKLGLDLVTEYHKGRMVHFDGAIKLQPWAPVTSTETRLVVNHGAKLRDWGSIIEYERPLFYYNTVVRLFGYYKNNNASSKLGFDHCQDCSLENHIWTNYKNKFSNEISVRGWVLQLCRTLQRSLIKNLHGRRFLPLTIMDIHKDLVKK